MFDHGHLAALGHRTDKALASAGHAKVDILRKRKKGGNGFAVGGGNDLDGVDREAGQRFDGGVEHDAGDGLVGVDGLLAAAEDRRVAALEAETRGVGRHVGARFVDDDDDADGDGEFPQYQSVGADPFVEQFAGRIGQGGHFTESAGHGGDAFVVQVQAIEHRGAETGLRAVLHVDGVGSLDGRTARFDGVGHGQQGPVLVGRAQSGESARGGFRLPAKLRHLFQQSHAGKARA